MSLQKIVSVSPTPDNMSLDPLVENQMIIEEEIESIKEEVLGIKEEVVDIKNELDSNLCNQEEEYEVELSSNPMIIGGLSLPTEQLSNVHGIKQELTVEHFTDEEQTWYSADQGSTLDQGEQVHYSTPDYVKFNKAISSCEESNVAVTPNRQPKDRKRIIIITEQKPNKNGKTFRCNICGKKFNGKIYLRTHKKLHGDKPFSCDICDKEFTQQGNLNSHKRIHTGEKPYPCHICEKGFTELGHLKRHIRTHTGAKPYVCEICDKKFKQTAHLNRHKLIHTSDSGDRPYTCETCNKKFLSASHLMTHARIHKGEKPYNCDLCDKKFTQLGQLKVHKQTHTGAKPYHCDICNVNFTLLGNLKKHIKRAHNQRESSEQVPK